MKNHNNPNKFFIHLFPFSLAGQRGDWGGFFYIIDECESWGDCEDSVRSSVIRKLEEVGAEKEHDYIWVEIEFHGESDSGEVQTKGMSLYRVKLFDWLTFFAGRVFFRRGKRVFRFQI